MAEYIEREAARECVHKWLTDIFGINKPGLTVLNKRIGAIPAADVRPVVKAKWRYKTMTVPDGKGQTYAKWSCTHCKGKSQYRTLYCPNCGAEMEDGA